jgi:hypothetical protein
MGVMDNKLAALSAGRPLHPVAPPRLGQIHGRVCSSSARILNPPVIL